MCLVLQMHPPTEEKCILAVDPGREKCGVALVKRSGTVLYCTVAETQALQQQIALLIEQYSPCALVLGNGTGHKPIRARLSTLSVPLHMVEEAHSTEEARKRFVQMHPPKGWQRLLPVSLRTPDKPCDDLTAVVLAERYWKQCEKEEENTP